jgi:DNA-binding helix-hairpin-helix protein with protein kinase domain
MFGLFGLIVSSDVGFQYLMFFGLAVRALWGALASDAPSEFAQTARAAETRLRTLEHSWKDEASGEQFHAKLDNLRALAQEYRQLVERRKHKLLELARALYRTQLHHHLEQFDISSADIPYIKDGRRAMLLAYGINDAADLTRPALQKVPGFSPLLIAQLMAWRRSLEVKFKFDPARGIDPADIQRVDQEVAKRRAEIELLLSKGPAELNDLRRRTVAARGRLQGQLEQALMDVAQAQADERAAA